MQPETQHQSHKNKSTHIQHQTAISTVYQPLRVVLIGLSATGKNQVAQILQSKYGFQVLKLDSNLTQTSKVITKLCFDDYKGRKVYLFQKPNYQTLYALKKRNFVNVILVQASPWKRFQNFIAMKKMQGTPEQLEEFLKKDQQDYDEEFQKCLEFVRVRIFNRRDLSFLERQVQLKKQLIIKPFRPSWGEYFMKIADIARRRSNCMKSSVGAVIVNSQNRVVSTGYNGTARGLASCFLAGCDRCNANSNTSLDHCLCLHAEQSAIIQVGISRTKGCDLYTTLYPCFSCAKVIKQAGISRIFYLQEYDKKDSGKYFLENNFDKETQIIQIKIDNIYY